MEEVKFQGVQHPPSLLMPFDGRLHRAELPSIAPPSGSFASPAGFVVDGILTKHEATWYIQEAERVGMHSLEGTFPKDYRSNDRLLTLSQSTAEALFKRILPALQDVGKEEATQVILG